jgi:hypothetical protein
MQLVMKLPTKETPGYLRRQKRALEFRERARADGSSPKLIDEMVEFLLPFVQEPEDPAQAREALWDASESQFDEIMASITGGGGAVNPPSAGA